MCAANPYVKTIHLLMEREADKAFIVNQGVHDPCGKLKFVFLGKYLTYHGTCVLLAGPVRLMQGVTHHRVSCRASCVVQMRSNTPTSI